MKETYTVKELAEKLGIEGSAVLRWIANGSLKSTRVKESGKNGPAMHVMTYDDIVKCLRPKKKLYIVFMNGSVGPHIYEKIKILKDFGIYLTKEQFDHMLSLKTEIAVDNYAQDLTKAYDCNFAK